MFCRCLPRLSLAPRSIHRAPILLDFSICERAGSPTCCRRWAIAHDGAASPRRAVCSTCGAAGRTPQLVGRCGGGSKQTAFSYLFACLVAGDMRAQGDGMPCQPHVSPATGACLSSLCHGSAKDSDSRRAKPGLGPEVRCGNSGDIVRSPTTLGKSPLRARLLDEKKPSPCVPPSTRLRPSDQGRPVTYGVVCWQGVEVEGIHQCRASVCHMTVVGADVHALG